MASVTSLDQDMRNLRMSRYTPAAAEQVRTWIESTLGEQLTPGDLLDVLKDGVALCRLASLILPAIRYKSSAMPFIQMENISSFLTACEMPPLQLPAHDRFLTVDLYEKKDPAQVLQCLGAFSRQAHAVKPNVFRTTIGPKKNTAGTMSPASTGAGATNGAAGWAARPHSGSVPRAPSPTKNSEALPGARNPLSPNYTGESNGSQGGRGDPGKSPPGLVSSWSRKTDESSTAPAWNIHQYGYMGGASQGNQGISFGSRRQIISSAPDVPSLAEKERMRKEKAAEEARRQRQAEEEERRQRLEQEAEEARARREEEREWEEETRKHREEEKRRLEEQKKQWEDQETRWKEEEEVRRREDAEIQAIKKRAPEKPRVPSSSILRGQTLSQYQREQAAQQSTVDGPSTSTAETPEQARVRELERQLEEARERERQYQTEREERLRQDQDKSRPNTAQTDPRPQSAGQSETSWVGDEREYLRKEWQNGRDAAPQEHMPAPLPARPLPQPSRESQPAPMPSDRESQQYTSPSQSRTDRFLATNVAPEATGPRVSASQEAGDSSLEQQRDRDARLASQRKTKAGGWASKSLLEREMERERERQREWEADQEKLRTAPRDAAQGTGAGQSWDVNQYGFMGGDNMNRGSGAGSGINIGAGRRQILGPREMGSGRK